MFLCQHSGVQLDREEEGQVSEGVKSQSTIFRSIIALSAVFSSAGRAPFCAFVHVCDYVATHI